MGVLIDSLSRSVRQLETPQDTESLQLVGLFVGLLDLLFCSDRGDDPVASAEDSLQLLLWEDAIHLCRRLQ